MPARLNKIIAVAAEYGVTITTPSSGAHWKAKKAGCRTFPISAHNGARSEIPDEYIRGMCRCFGIDYKEFRAKL